MTILFTKLISVFMTIIALLSGGRVDKARLKITNEVTSSESRIEYELRNYSGTTLTTDEYFTLEKPENGEWTTNWQKDIDGDIIVNDTGITVAPFSAHNGSVDLGRQGVTLPEGTYRLTKTYGTPSGRGEASVVFTVVKGNAAV